MYRTLLFALSFAAISSGCIKKAAQSAPTSERPVSGEKAITGEEARKLLSVLKDMGVERLGFDDPSYHSLFPIYSVENVSCSYTARGVIPAQCFLELRHSSGNNTTIQPSIADAIKLHQLLVAGGATVHRDGNDEKINLKSIECTNEPSRAWCLFVEKSAENEKQTTAKRRLSGDIANKLLAGLQKVGIREFGNGDPRYHSLYPIYRAQDVRCTYAPRGFVWVQCSLQASYFSGKSEGLNPVSDAAFTLFSMLKEAGLAPTNRDGEQTIAVKGMECTAGQKAVCEVTP